MAFYFEPNVADLTELKTFLDSKLVTEHGFTKGYTSGDYSGYKKKNVINELTGVEAHFTPVFLLRATEFGLSLARAITAGPETETGLIPEVNTPIVTGLVAPYDIYLLVNDYRVVLGVENSSGELNVLVAGTVDYRYLDQGAISGNATHETELRNNSQCIFKVGDIANGRLLYAGDLTDQNQYNIQMDVDFLSTNDTTFSRMPLDSVTNRRPIAASVALVKQNGQNDSFQGVLSGIYLCNSSAFFPFDVGVDTLGNQYRYFRDSVSGEGIIVREAT